jgi:hypothetical protein
MRREARGGPWGRLVFGAIILTVGVIFWLDRLGSINARDYLEWWPVALIAIGVAHLLQRRWAGAVIWMLIGIYFLLPLAPWHIMGLWPLLISVGGVTLMLQSLRARRDAGAFRAVAVMGGNNRTIGSQHFTGGEAVAVMAGCEIDLAAAQIPAGEAVIDVLAFWGGVEIRVPKGWKAVGHVAPILGGYIDNTAPAAENAPRVVIRGSAIMGGVGVRNSTETRA